MGEHNMPTNPAYQSMMARSKWTRDTVAAAWANNRPANGSNIASPDGRIVVSYGHHIIAVTDERGKVAYDCHYSVTTAKQCGPLKVIADIVVPCASCNR